jgi:uncharacterized damage-inducible protein DinB
MLSTLRELFEHQEWADGALLQAVKGHPGAAEDEEMRRVLLHIVLVQRFFHSLLAGTAFDRQAESREPASFEELEERFRETHRRERELLKRLAQPDMERMVDLPFGQPFRLAVRQVLTQVVMHGQGHRAQCATRLRQLGGKPPVLDFILWARDHSPNEISSSSDR